MIPKPKLTGPALVVASDFLMIGLMIFGIMVILWNSFCRPFLTETATTAEAAVAGSSKAPEHVQERAAIPFSNAVSAPLTP